MNEGHKFIQSTKYLAWIVFAIPLINFSAEYVILMLFDPDNFEQWKASGFYVNWEGLLSALHIAILGFVFVYSMHLILKKYLLESRD